VSENIDGTDAGNAFGLHVGNWAVGVSVTFPSLEIFRMRARQRVEEERIRGVAAQYDRTVQALQTQEARSRAFMVAAAQIAANTPAQLRAARDGDAQARARYDAGLTTVLEVAEAQRLLAAAEADSAVANLAVWRAMLAESALRGTLQPFLEKTAAAPIAPAR
jgi:outer membrane protein TolC